MTKQETIDLMQKIALDIENNPEVRYQTWIIFFINEVYRQIVEPLEAALEAKEAVNQLYKGTVTLQGYDKADLIERVKKAENELAEVKEELKNSKLAYEIQAVELGKLYDKYHLLQDQMKLHVAEASKLEVEASYKKYWKEQYNDLQVYLNSLEEGDNITITSDFLDAMDKAEAELAVYKRALKLVTDEIRCSDICCSYRKTCNGNCTEKFLEQARKELEGKK